MDDGKEWKDQQTGSVDRECCIRYQVADVVPQGEGGLLGMVQHPDFINNGFIYVVYNYNKDGVYTEKVVRLTYTSNAISNPVTIIDGLPASSIHNGSRLFVTSDNKLWHYGDAANSVAAQNTTNSGGKVLRLNLDGTIPQTTLPNNPMWSMGH
jgi:glucose/arabinose dehydrogenase